MKIEYEGQFYEFSYADLTAGECEEIEKYCSVRGLGEWSTRVQDANTRALQAYWWAVRRHAGEDSGPIARKDPAFRPVAFHEALADAEKREAAEEAARKAAEEEAEDPTPPLLASSSPAYAVTLTTPAPAAASPSLPG